MAVDKLVDRTQLDADLTSVADAIRAKGGTSASLVFPEDFVTAIGNISGGSTPQPLTMGTIRPDATLVQAYTYDKWMLADEVLTSLPEYTTTATTLVATAALSPTVTLDYANYDYFVLERAFTYPTYSVTSKAKGRAEYHVLSRAYEIAEVPGNNFIAFLDGTTKYTSRTITTVDCGAFQRLLYWSSATAVTPYSTGSYGTVQAVVAPTISSGVLTINSPNFNIRGSTTYFTSTYFNALTDIRYQYKIEVYKAPKTNTVNGWTHTSQMAYALSCVNSSTRNLT